MKASSVDTVSENLASGYGKLQPDGSRAKMPFVSARGMKASTGITSNVEDMARFIALQFRRGPVGGDQILSAAGLRLMHRARVLDSDWRSGNAVGFAVRRERDKVYMGHAGTYFGYRSHTLLRTDIKVGVIVFANDDDSNPGDIALHLMQSVGETAGKIAASSQSETPWDPRWRRFAGKYRSVMGGQVEVIELNRQLVTINPSGPFPYDPYRLIPAGDGSFRLETPSGGPPVGEAVRFVETDDGTIKMYIGGGYALRVSDDENEDCSTAHPLDGADTTC